MSVLASAQVTLSKVSDGETGAAGADGKMLYATSSTAAATAAKTAALSGFSLYKGATVSVKFTYANTAASPTLNVNSTGAKAIYLNGVRYAYWVANETVVFVYDGTNWQVCSTPVYANTATIGNPSSYNMYLDGSSLNLRNGTTVRHVVDANGETFRDSSGADLAWLRAYSAGQACLYGTSGAVLSYGTSTTPADSYLGISSSSGVMAQATKYTIQGQSLTYSQMEKLAHAPETLTATSGFPSGVSGTIVAWRFGAVMALYMNVKFTATFASWKTILPSTVQTWLLSRWGSTSSAGAVICPIFCSPTDSWVLSLNVDTGKVYLWDTAYSHASGSSAAGSGTFVLRG